MSVKKMKRGIVFFFLRSQVALFFQVYRMHSPTAGAGEPQCDFFFFSSEDG